MGGKNYSEDLKKAVISAHKKGLSYGQISKLMEIPRSTVSTMVKNHKMRGTVKNLTKTGGPRKTSKIDDRKIVIEAKKNPRLSKR